MQPDYSPYSINQKVQFPLNQDTVSNEARPGLGHKYVKVRVCSSEDVAFTAFIFLNWSIKNLLFLTYLGAQFSKIMQRR